MIGEVLQWKASENMNSNTVDGIIEQALQMPEKERALIAQRLILSLDSGADADVETAWQEEVQRRVGAIERGEIECIPWEDVRERLRANAHAKG